MSKNRFFIGEALRFGWRNFWPNWPYFLFYFLISCVLMLAQYGADFLVVKIFSDSPNISMILANAVSFIFFAGRIIVAAGLISVLLKIYNGKKIDIIDFFGAYKQFFSFVMTFILYAIIVVAGLLLLIVPGIIWALKYQFALTLVVDRKLNPFQALRKSAEMTAGLKWDLFGLVLVFKIVLLIGFLALIVGLLVAIPITALASIYVYKILLKEHTLKAAR